MAENENVNETVKILKERHEWLSAYLRDSGLEPNALVGAYEHTDNADTLIQGLRKLFNLSDDWNLKLKTAGDVLRLLKVKEKRYNKKMRKKYPSDITRAQFEHIRGILESGKKKTAPRKVDLYEIFCAILYLLKSGCQWRMLPETFPKWNTVYYYFSIWNKAQDEKPSLLHQCLKKKSWRGSYKTGAEVLQEQLSYSRCAEC